MKPLVICTLLLAITFKGICQEEKDIETDSLATEQYYTITPFLEKQSIQESSVAVYKIDDPSVLQFSLGNNILNGLNGQVPNLRGRLFSIDLRLHAPMLLVDGVPFSLAWSRDYNTNPFDFDQILTINSGNYSPLFGGYASNGLLSLQSKTGKDLTKPTFSFNENVTYQKNNLNGAFGGYSSNQWIFSTNVAYSQDFGKIDTRISYNHASTPNENSKFNQHSLRVNTGFEIIPKLTGRIILEENLSFSNNNLLPSNYNFESTKNLFNGNLFLAYAILDWLSVSSQLSYSTINTMVEQAQYKSQENKSRQYGNIFLRASREILKDFSISTFIGGKLESISSYRENKYQGSVVDASSKFKEPSWTGGIELNYENYLSASFSIGENTPTYFPNDSESLSYSIGSSFIFSEILARPITFWSLGKLRINYNQIDRANKYNYPYTPSNLTQEYILYNNQQLETGLDFTFFNNRIGASYTYFTSSGDNYLTNVPIDPSSGFNSTFINTGSIKTFGNEVVVYGDIIKNNETFLRTSLTWGQSTQEFVGLSNSGNNSQLPGSPNPKWVSYLTNHFSIKGFTARMITGLSYGGIGFQSEIGNNFVIYDRTYFDLTEVGLFYSFKKLIRSKIITDLNVGVVGRNTKKNYYKTDLDVYNAPFENPKNVSFNFGITF